MYSKITYKFLIVNILLFVSHVCMAQDKLEFNVVDFGIDQFSTTAQDKRFEKYDDDGNRYAIIKVKDTDGEGGLEGFTFNFGSLNSIVESHGDELWVFVQRNAKTVTIKRPGYKTIEKYNLNTTIQPGRVYEMRITMSRVRKVVEHDITKQVLQFVVSPANENAIVKIKKINTDSEYELWGEVDETGSIDKIMDFGTYDYIVSAANYQSSTGRVNLSDSKTTFVEKVSLKPNFGFLVVDDAYGISGAQLFVDDVRVGIIPYRDSKKRWSSGSHKITVTNGDLYKTYNSTFTIEQGDTTFLSPKLEPDFAQTTIYVDADAELFLDGKSIGHKTWTGPLKAGKYIVECKQDKHKSTSRSINVKVDQAETFEVPTPIAITGSIYVKSKPSGALITVDGEDKGVTPVLIHDMIIGEHIVKLSMPNHKAEQYDITVKEGETSNIEGELSDIARMTIDSKPSNAELSIDGKVVGTTPYTKDMASGDYDLEIQRSKYQTFQKRVHLDSANPTIELLLKRQYQRSNTFFIQPYLQAGNNNSVGASVGGYLANVNIEGYYAIGLKKSEMIYWNAIDTDEKPCGYVYKSSMIGGKLGYGFVFLNTRMRVTPQIGLGVVNISATETYNNSSTFDASKAYAISASVGTKVEFAIVNGLGVFVAPEYSFAIKKSNYYRDMASISFTIKNYASGFNARIGLSIFF